MSTSPPLVVADRYRLVAPLGQGGMGRVWRATDVVLHRDVAIKELVPPPGLTPDERREMRERSLREARAIARLNNINVVRVFDVLRTDADPWIVMEYVPSRSLQDILASDGPFTPVRAAEIGLGVLGALRAAHRAGVVHRDVKPGNVLIGEDGRVVLTDFGLATVPGDPNVTRTGLVLGSPAYIAPERARDGTAGPGADLWSLGATLYAAVEGASPFARPSAIATLAALATENPPPARNAGPLKPVLNGLLRKDPAHRINADEAERLLLRATGRRSKLSFPMSPTMRRPGVGRERPSAGITPPVVPGSAPVVPGPRPPVSPARPPAAEGRPPVSPARPQTEGRPPIFAPGKASVGRAPRPPAETPTRVDAPKPPLDATLIERPNPNGSGTGTASPRSQPGDSSATPGHGLDATMRGSGSAFGSITAAEVAAHRKQSAAQSAPTTDQSKATPVESAPATAKRPRSGPASARAVVAAPTTAESATATPDAATPDTATPDTAASGSAASGSAMPEIATPGSAAPESAASGSAASAAKPGGSRARTETPAASAATAARTAAEPASTATPATAEPAAETLPAEAQPGTREPFGPRPPRSSRSAAAKKSVIETPAEESAAAASTDAEVDAAQADPAREAARAPQAQRADQAEQAARAPRAQRADQVEEAATAPQHEPQSPSAAPAVEDGAAGATAAAANAPSAGADAAAGPTAAETDTAKDSAAAEAEPGEADKQTLTPAVGARAAAVPATKPSRKKGRGRTTTAGTPAKAARGATAQSPGTIAGKATPDDVDKATTAAEETSAAKKAAAGTETAGAAGIAAEPVADPQSADKAETADNTTADKTAADAAVTPSDAGTSIGAPASDAGTSTGAPASDAETSTGAAPSGAVRSDAAKPADAATSVNTPKSEAVNPDSATKAQGTDGEADAGPATAGASRPEPGRTRVLKPATSPDGERSDTAKRPHSPAAEHGTAGAVHTAPISGVPGLGRASRPAWQPMTVRAPSSGGRGLTIFGTTLTRRQTVIAAGVLLAVLLAMVVLIPVAFAGGSNDQAKDNGRKTGAAPGVSATQPTTAATSAPAAPAPTPSNLPSSIPSSAPPVSSAPPAGNGNVTLPKGWYIYKDSTGFSVPMPEGVSIEHRGSEVYFKKDNRLLIIDQTDQPQPDPVADWKRQEADRAGRVYRDYQRIKIEEVGYFVKAADWEFTYTTSSGNPQHAVKRGVITEANKRAYGISWYTSPGDWEAAKKDLQLIYQGFKPKS